MRSKKTLAYLLAAFACAAPAAAMTTTGAPPPAAAVEQDVSAERGPAARPDAADGKKKAVHGHGHERADEKQGNRKSPTGKKDE